MWRTYTTEKKLLQKVGILTKLKDQGISKVHINFSGSGDSGDIDDVEVEDMFGNSAWHQSYNAQNLTQDDSNKLMDLFFDTLDEEVTKYGDWVNNEGGYGTFIIDTDTAQFELDYNQRTVLNHFQDGKSIYE